MAKLVVLSEGFTGLSYELQAEKTTVGRVEDNLFAIAEQSISSHHCEIHKRGEGFLVKDLGSTNGTFINGEPVTEATLKPGQILRLGSVEMRLETGAAAAAKKPLDKTVVLPQGVSLQEFGQTNRTSVDTASTGFSKKSNKINTIFVVIGIGLGLVIVVILIIAFQQMTN